MNMHVDFGAQDWEVQHRMANVVACDTLLHLLTLHHSNEPRRFNPRNLPVIIRNRSPIIEGYLAEKHRQIKAQRVAALEAIMGEPRITIMDIRRAVCQHFKTTSAMLNAKRRTAPVVYHRSVALYLARELTPRSLPEIGRSFGGMDHSSVLHACRKIDGKTKSDDAVRKDIEVLRHRLQVAL
jgi:hypothetical protein